MPTAFVRERADGQHGDREPDRGHAAAARPRDGTAAAIAAQAEQRRRPSGQRPGRRAGANGISASAISAPCAAAVIGSRPRASPTSRTAKNAGNIASSPSACGSREQRAAEHADRRAARSRPRPAGASRRSGRRGRRSRRRGCESANEASTSASDSSARAAAARPSGTGRRRAPSAASGRSSASPAAIAATRAAARRQHGQRRELRGAREHDRSTSRPARPNP